MTSQIKLLIILAGLTILSSHSQAQSSRDLCINEVLILNSTNYQDNYGSRNAWIEIFNKAYNKVNIGGCFFTDDINNPTKYRIPKNDPNTLIPSRFFIIFWADNKTTHGTFHLNFELDSTSRFIALFDSDGRTLIDSITVPLSKVDISYGRVKDGETGWSYLEKTTPMATNITTDLRNAGQKIAQSDPSGIGMSLVAMSVVFAALLLLYLFFKQVGKYNIHSQKKKIEAHAAKEGRIAIHEEVSGEVFAAISAAIYLYETEQHDYESAILTINRVAKTYSPWSSKIYGLRQNPHKESRSNVINK